MIVSVTGELSHGKDSSVLVREGGVTITVSTTIGCITIKLFTVGTVTIELKIGPCSGFLPKFEDHCPMVSIGVFSTIEVALTLPTRVMLEVLRMARSAKRLA